MPYSLTPSKLNLIKDCPKCFWLEHNKGIKRPDSIFPSLPSGMDRILKVHFDNYADIDELPPELIGKKDMKDVKIFKDKKLLNVWRENWTGIQYKADDGNILKGAVDAILQRGDKLIVLDYKTRGYPPKEDTHKYYVDQLNIYNYLLRKNGYDTDDNSFLLIYHPDKVIESVFHFHTDLVKIKTSVKDAEKLWKDAINLLEGPMPPASKECQFCKYRDTKIGATLLDY
ncbi:PD-(D/E)XK nuclease family protein [Candidatus Woesearchaeota archaeon]|nr:PD-(D/E)XK nuclease family protein [Candidatus Woesearchaeota archaeon]